MKVGDRVRVKKGSYKDYPVTSRYNLPRCNGVIAEGGSIHRYMLVVFDNGYISPPVTPNEFELVEEKKMAKFKVGDFVTSEGWSRKEGHEIVKIEDGYYYLGSDGNYAWPYNIDVWDNKFLMVKGDSPKSPIVEKTIKSVVPSNYGKFRIATELPSGIPIYIGLDGAVFNAEELEVAAKLFIELAEYLKEKDNG